MTTQTIPKLVKLGETDLTVANPEEDIRGRDVVDNSGEKFGEVKNLMLDEIERKVRFIEIGSGGILGVGEKTFLLPVDAIRRIDSDHVHVNQSYKQVSGAPAYDPDLVREQDFSDAYGYYGMAPFWGPGYSYPAYPYYSAI